MGFVRETFLLIFLSLVCFGYVTSDDLPTREFEIKMPKALPSEPETYLCTPVKLDRQNTNYIVGFEPRADKKTAHHMLLYGCKSPGREDPLFNCGAMTVRQSGLSSALNPCGSGSSIIYAWAQNAPKLKLPSDVAFRVGGPDSGIDWLVLQVHYASVDYIPTEGDESGLVLKYTNIPQPKAAGIYWTATNGRFPAQSTTNAETACKINTDIEIHPFAFRVHTHSIGRIVSGYKVSPNMEWTLIGKEDPQLPQMFYPVVDNTTVISNGDTVATRCTMVNNHDYAVYVGNTKQDEMCNFYIMFWVDGVDLPSQSTCSSMGPPIYSWGGWLFGGGLTKIPDKEASSFD